MFWESVYPFWVEGMRDYVGFSLVFEYGAQRAISTESFCRVISIDMAEDRHIWKTRENTKCYRFTCFIPKLDTGGHRCSLNRNSKGVTTRISGVQKVLIYGWYPVDILDIQLLDSVGTWLFLAIFQGFYSLTTVHGYLAIIWVYPADIFLIFCWNLSDI